MTQGNGYYEINIRGATLQLLSQRALFWIETRTLFVADLHLGKDVTFRKGGLAVPAGSNRESLNRLRSIIGQFQPSRCVVLGDFIHAANSLSQEVIREVTDFFEQTASCQWHLVRGNHDRKTDQWPKSWPIRVHEKDYLEEPFRFVHVPPDAERPRAIQLPERDGHERSHLDNYFLAGHIHPAFRCPGNSIVGGKLACFWLMPEGMVLPAFGAFTGTKSIEPLRGDRVFVIAEDSVIPFPVIQP
jgi:DNA ligase-associated metallophosphoesterase